MTDHLDFEKKMLGSNYKSQYFV